MVSMSQYSRAVISRVGAREASFLQSFRLENITTGAVMQVVQVLDAVCLCEGPQRI